MGSFAAAADFVHWESVFNELPESERKKYKIHSKEEYKKHFILEHTDPKALTQFELDAQLTEVPPEERAEYIEQSKLAFKLLAAQLETSFLSFKDDVANTGVVGAVADAEKNEHQIKVDLIDNYEITVKEFNEKYGNSKTVEKQLIEIDK